MHVLAVFCHPRRDSFSGAVLDRFCDGVREAGHTVEVADLHSEAFDPVMTSRDLEQFDGVQMPDDVLAEQARVERSDALAFIFPIWWYGMPAMFKGWLDRVWSNGWAYAWEHDPEGSLLETRPCVMLVPTGASQALMGRFGYDKEIDHFWRYGVLGYCGVEPIRIELMLDAAFDSGAHDAHLETAYRAGREIAEMGASHDRTPQEARGST